MGEDYGTYVTANDILCSVPMGGTLILAIPRVTRVIFNGEHTVVKFDDGTTSVVRRQRGERHDEEKAIMAAILKRVCKGWQTQVRKALPEGHEL